MTERSGPWDGTSIGDATEAAYDAPTEFARFLEGLHGGTTNRGGVVVDKLNELAVTAPGSISPCSVASGWGIVYGTWYESDSAVSVAIPTPAVSTRIDRIVLRKDWSAQTVRVTRIAGTEGAGAPSLTQIVGTTWDVPLAQVSITTGGAITLTDQRVFVPVHADRSAESGTHHAAGQISGLPATADSAPVTPTYGDVAAIGADTGNYANDDHNHGMNAAARGAIAQSGSVTLISNTVLTDLTGLTFAVSNGDKWVGRAIVKADPGGDGIDLKVGISCPAGTLTAYIQGQVIGAPTTQHEVEVNASGGSGSFEVDVAGGDIRKVEVDFVYEAAANGTFAIQVAQAIISATPMPVNGFMTAMKE